MGIIMVFMMGFMMVVAIAVAFLLVMSILGIVRNTEGKAKRTDLEKPKRHRLALSDDGELVEINEAVTPLFYDAEERP